VFELSLVDRGFEISKLVGQVPLKNVFGSLDQLVIDRLFYARQP
jgi:hypothetical protein